MHATYGEIQASLHHLLLAPIWVYLTIVAQLADIVLWNNGSSPSVKIPYHRRSSLAQCMHHVGSCLFHSSLYRRTTPHQKLDHHLPQWNGSFPICSMYAMFTNMCPKNQPNVGKYTIHGAYVRLSKPLVWRIDINIIWKGPIANHSFVAILPSLGNIDWQGVSLRLNTAQVDVTLYL